MDYLVLDDKYLHVLEFILFDFHRSWNFIRFCCKKQARIESKIKLWKTQEILKEKDN